MDAHKGNLTALLPQKVGLDQLELGKNKQAVVVRVLRMWEAKIFKLNGTLMSLDLLLLDEKDTLIQASIYHRRIPRFKDLLKEGSIYLISSFEIVPTYSHYKVADNLLTMRFIDTTQIIEVGEEDCSIKPEKFRPHLCRISYICRHQPSLTSKSSIRVTLWDDQASDFRQQFHQTVGDYTVIVCTCLNPKMFADGNEGKIKSEDGKLLPTFATTSKIVEVEDEENGEYQRLSEENDEKTTKKMRLRCWESRILLSK